MKKVDVHISDIINSQRIDVAYFTEKIGEASFVPLSKYVEIKGGKRIPKGKSFSQEKTNYLYLRLSEIDDSGIINYDSLKCISEDLFNTLQRYEIKNDQVVFSIAGTIGRVFVIKDIPSDKRIVLTENCAKIQPKTEQVLSDYISILLNCSFVQKQIERNKIQTTIPKIGLDRIAKLKIPEITSLDLQKEIIHIYQNAQNARLKKTNEVKRLLNSIDDYIVDVLGIVNTEHKEQSNSFYKQKISSIIGGRFDPPQFHPERTETLDKIKKGNWCKLRSVIHNVKTTTSSISKNDTYVGLENINGDTGEYVITNEKESISSAALFKKGNILFPKLRPYLNKVHRAQFDGCCSTEFHVFEAHDIHPDFLTIVLRSNLVLAQTKHLMTGNTLPRLQTTDIENLIIPYPDMDVQVMIVDFVRNIQYKVNLLKEDGNRLIDDAKLKIENIILR